MKDCLFCKIVNGSVASYKFWENSAHIAILDIYPSVVGQSLILTKKHQPSYVFDIPENEYLVLMAAAREVSKIIDKKLKAIRTCLVMEGMEVEHAHLKLYPIYTILNNVSEETADLNEYPGYLTTLHGQLATEKELYKTLQSLVDK